MSKKKITKFINSLFQKNIFGSSEGEVERKLLEIQKIIGYQFQNILLLKAALTHDSLCSAHEAGVDGDANYERMEFLGDAVLGLVVCEHLFNLFPEKNEGDLSKLKSNIVSEKYLALKANAIKLHEYIFMSEKEDKNGGRGRKSIISDTVESIICAIYIDGGIKKAKRFITNFILVDFEKQVLLKDLINYKSILQEYTQALYQKTPEYKIVSEAGPDHHKIFKVEVYINDELQGQGEGLNKKDAQQKAAQDACKKLKLK